MLPTNVAMEDIQTEISPIYNTNASESLRSQLADVLDFLADFHTLSKVKVITAPSHCLGAIRFS